MITVETELEPGRSFRVFVATSSDLVPSGGVRLSDVAESARSEYWDEDDVIRSSALLALIAEPNVRAIAYPSLPEEDILQVFFRRENALVFACTLVSRVRLRTMLSSELWIVEGFSLQVAPGEHLSTEAVRAGIQSWIERAFPEVVLPSITVDLWTGPAGISRDLLALLRHPPDALLPEQSQESPADLVPDPTIVTAPYGEAA